MHGHFRGTATRGSDVVHTEIIIAADGASRLYLGAANVKWSADNSLVPSLLAPADPMHASGHVVVEDERATGAGILVGENCSVATNRPVCTAPANVEVDLRMSRGVNDGVAGEMRIGAPLTATWQISARQWNFYYRNPAKTEHLDGIVAEQLSELGRAEKMRIIVDTSDRVFFQSTTTGCIGNGTLAPHADGRFMVFDVSVLIESCAERFAHLNGPYGGLATWTNDTLWDYDSSLLMYLSSTDAGTPRAFTMFGPYEYPPPTE
jgi:hypothetical protein